MQRVANHRFLFRRGDVYYFRRAVPKQARKAFGGKLDITVSLQTTNLSEARHALAARLKDFERVVAAQRRLPDPTVHAARVTPLMHEPSREEIEEAVREWLQREDARFVDDVLAMRIGDQTFAKELEQYGDAVTRSMKARPSDPELMTRWIADHLTNERGWIITADGTARRLLMNRVARAQIAHSKLAGAEVQFEPRPLPDEIFSPEKYAQDRQSAERRSRNKPVSIISLLEGYCREARPAPATIKAWNTCLRSLVDHLGHDVASKVTKSDIIAWKDALLHPADGSPGRSQNTIGKKYLAAAKTVFGWAERNLHISTNPTDKVRIAIPAKEHLRAEPGLSDWEATLILNRSRKKALHLTVSA